MTKEDCLDMPRQEEYIELLRRASQVAKNAYAPYSSFQVGAALLAEGGQIYTGCNVENASYGLTICAEQAAVCCSIAEGVRKWKAIAVRAWNGNEWVDPCLPCGACRQILAEFQPDLFIVTADPNKGRGGLFIDRLDRLLAAPFRYNKP